MIKLRDYQIEAKKQVATVMAKGKRRVILAMPTGAGKTVTFVDILNGAVNKGKTAMIICDRIELLQQANAKLLELGLNATVIAPGYPQVPNQIYLASVDTLRRREIPKIDLLIVDEAHKQSFDKLLKRIVEEQNPFLIGATATPLRTGSQNCLSEIYQDIVEPIDINYLLENNFLVNAKTYAAQKDFSKLAKAGGDFDARALFQAFDSPELYSDAVGKYLKFANGTKAICFNVNVEHSKNMCKEFNNAGISAKHLDGNTEKELRKTILKEFKEGVFQVLCNCSVLTTGFDEPSIETVIVNRATLSLPLWLQMIGRGSRLFPGKEHFTIIDMGANVYRHGLYDEKRTWKLHKKAKRTDGVAPVKLCKNCEAINPASARVCIQCDYEFPKPKKELIEADFVEVKKKKIIEIQRGWAMPDPKTATLQELEIYAEKRGYKKEWAWVQLKINGRV